MFRGNTEELPEGGLVREREGIRFYIYRAKGVTMPFWQDKMMVCALVSDIPTEQLIPLALKEANSLRCFCAVQPSRKTNPIRFITYPSGQPCSTDSATMIQRLTRSLIVTNKKFERVSSAERFRNART